MGFLKNKLYFERFFIEPKTKRSGRSEEFKKEYFSKRFSLKSNFFSSIVKTRIGHVLRLFDKKNENNKNKVNNKKNLVGKVYVG